MVDRREFRFEFPCPQCQARLRLQNRHLIGTHWNCPECQTPLEILDAGTGDLVARIATNTSPQSSVTVKRGITPQTAAALVAITLILGVAVFILWTPGRSDSPLVVRPTITPPVSPITTQTPSETPAPVANPVEGQLTAIGRWLLGQQQQMGAFPSALRRSGVPVSEQLGWLAQYRVASEPQESIHPSPTHGWRDPANEPFVRRRAPTLLNPRVVAVASDEGYPASHYVGVSGVGADAAQLPKSHPRAGVFGLDRRTTVGDIRDGTANTLLVMGVENHPPAWASGAESIRGLTGEPYFSGPDHFGTGQADGMQVLMADGSVRFLSKQTDPRIMRRMAAMADGLPLDPTVPGEPENLPVPIVDPSEEPKPLIAQHPPVDPAADMPLTVEVTPETKGYDVDHGLSVSIIRYQLLAPVPLRTLLRELVELSALPIDTSAVQNSARLDLPVTLDLQQTTPREILSEALKQVQLEFTADSQGIHLREVESPETP